MPNFSELDPFAEAAHLGLRLSELRVEGLCNAVGVEQQSDPLNSSKPAVIDAPDTLETRVSFGGQAQWVTFGSILRASAALRKRRPNLHAVIHDLSH